MLKLKKIKKYYKVGDTTTKALDGVSVAFRKHEFVSILGPSGSGKTTLLNIIGGLDNYDSGDMIINGKSTKTFKPSDWDAYRNNSIGFVFQSYNLISHLGILENVELGMTLSGVPKAIKQKKAEKALTRVGLKDHINKKPSQLSGGQMQRVAIARALANDPSILLCDEPTGALDSKTSVQIMKLIKELSKEKLVIMVTHNPKLAHQYSDRIIEFSDGKIKKDSNPYKERKTRNTFKLKHTKMSFLTALNLSFNNIRTKKGRTLLTSFASSIGIIGVAIVLALSNGMQKQIDNSQTETMSKFPITISKTTSEQPSEDNSSSASSDPTYPKTDSVTMQVSNSDKLQHENKIDDKYIDYIKKIDPKLSNNIGFTRNVGMNLARKVDNKYVSVSFSNEKKNNDTVSMSSLMASVTGVSISSFPTQLDNSNYSFLKDNYDVLSGDYPKEDTDIILIVDGNNNTNLNALENLGFDVKENEKVKFDDIIGTEIKVLSNNDYYQKLPTNTYAPTKNLASIYNNSDNITLKVTGILRTKKDTTMNLLAPGFAYSDNLVTSIVEKNKNSDIVKAQKDSDYNVLTNETLEDNAKDSVITYLGGNSTPSTIMIYPNSYDDKDKILSYLDKYNKGKSKEDTIVYTDLASTMIELTGSLMSAVTYVLIAFAGISLITSMIMIGIITYTSVLERTKEIGVLKALGARKKDITRVFDAETFILGLSSGILGVLIAWLLTFPLNSAIEAFSDLKNVAVLNPIHALILVIISTILTMMGGHIPARMAAKKDAAIALRAE